MKNIFDFIKKHNMVFTVIGSIVFIMAVYLINIKIPINTLFLKIMTSVYAVVLLFYIIKEKRCKRFYHWHFYFRDAY